MSLVATISELARPMVVMFADRALIVRKLASLDVGVESTRTFGDIESRWRLHHVLSQAALVSPAPGWAALAFPATGRPWRQLRFVLDNTG